MQDITIKIAVLDDATKSINNIEKKFGSLSETLRGMKVSTGDFNNYLKDNNLIATKSGQVFNRFTGETQDLAVTMDNAAKMGRRFKMEYLGIMFLGMQLQRTFKNITISTLKFYRDTVDGQTAAAQAITRVIGAWQLLKFTIGDAIAQFLLAHPEIITFIENIADWVDKNSELVAQLVILGLALGSTLFIVGQLGLGVQALSRFFTAFGATGILSSLAIVLALTGLLAVGKAVYEELTGENISFGQFFVKTLTFIIKVLNTFFQLVYYGTKIVIAGFKVAFNLIKASLLGVLAIMTAEIEDFVNKFIKALNVIIMAINKAFGSKIKLIPELDLNSNELKSKALDAISKANEAVQFMYDIPSLSEMWNTSIFAETENQTEDFTNIDVSNTQQNDLLLEILNELKSQSETEDKGNVTISNITLSQSEQKDMYDKMQEIINSYGGGVRNTNL